MLQTRTAPAAPLHFIPSAHVTVGVPADARANCSSCPKRDLCLPGGFSQQELQRFDGLMFARRKVKAGETLYRQGEGFLFLYAVRSGTFKSSVAVKDGREHVTGFHLAGDVLGLEGVASGRHATEAVALEDAEICAIPYAQLEALAAENPHMQVTINQLMSRHIVREQRTMLLLASMSAEQRVGSFLLNISERMRQRGYSPREFHLRMSRAEIASFLGLTIETVSRAFSAFQKQRLLEVAKKHIRILDLDAMNEVFEAQPA